MITDIRLQHFRSYADESFELSPSVNIIVGPNASGKTNLLEAILMLARGWSYRAKDSELITYKKPWARLDAHTINGQRTTKITAEPQATKNYTIDGREFKRLSPAHSLPVVLFEPEHLQLLTGGPERRRNYLDELLMQTIPSFGLTLRQYKRALSQRNTLLKKPGSEDGDLFPWNVRLSELAATIVRGRTELINQLNNRLQELYTSLSNSKTKVSIAYSTPFSVEHYETNMLKKLEASTELDRLRGFTTVGPHREDFEVFFDGHLASLSASRGENRTLILALKILELDILQTARETIPILLLDDVFSELDGARRQALTGYLQPYQTFITTTDADVVVQHFMDKCHIIPIGS